MSVLVIPGGWAPDRLRRFPAACALVANCHKAGAVVGHICHGGSLAVSVHILKGVRSTAFPSIKDDLVYAGAVWSDDRVVSDQRIVSAQVRVGGVKRSLLCFFFFFVWFIRGFF